jgi:hypothetical protein
MNHHIKTRRGVRLASAMLLASLVSMTLLAGCTTQQAYSTGQAWRQNECNKLTDMSERQRCMKEAGQPYDAYQKDVDNIKK